MSRWSVNRDAKRDAEAEQHHADMIALLQQRDEEKEERITALEKSNKELKVRCDACEADRERMQDEINGLKGKGGTKPNLTDG